jgi:hypothetical protein
MTEQNIKPDVTTHYWFAELPQEIKEAFHRVALSPSIMSAFNEFYPAPVYKTDVVVSMNEVYIAASDSTIASSDNVLYVSRV